MENVRVTVGETEEDMTVSSDEFLCAYNHGQPPGDTFYMICTERMRGRYVRVTALEINESLHLREVQIYGW